MSLDIGKLNAIITDVSLIGNAAGAITATIIPGHASEADAATQLFNLFTQLFATVANGLIHTAQATTTTTPTPVIVASDAKDVVQVDTATTVNTQLQ